MSKFGTLSSPLDLLKVFKVYQYSIMINYRNKYCYRKIDCNLKMKKLFQFIFILIIYTTAFKKFSLTPRALRGPYTSLIQDPKYHRYYHLVLWSHLKLSGPIFVDCRFYAYSRGCDFVGWSVFSFTKKNNSFKICFC